MAKRLFQRVATVVTVTACSVAMGDVRRTLGVVLSKREPAKALQLQRELDRRLQQDERLEWVDLESAVAPSAFETTRSVEESARRELGGVAALVNQAEFESARSRAEQALPSLRQSDLRRTRDELIEMLVYLGRIKLALKVDDLGLAEFTQALLLDPNQDAPRGMNSDEKKRLEAARLAVRESRAAAFTVSSDVPGLLWMDGVYVGPTPVAMPTASAGRHFFTFVAPGYAPVVSSEVLGTLAQVKVAAQATEQGRQYRALVAEFLSGNTGALEELRTWARANEVVVCVAETSTCLVSRRNAVGALSRSVPIGDLPSAVSALLGETISPALAVSPPPPPPVLSESPAAPAQQSKVAGWVLVVSGAVVAVAGGVLIGASAANYESASKIPQVQADEYGRQVGMSNGLAAGGIAAGAVGVLALGLGVGFVW